MITRSIILLAGMLLLSPAIAERVQITNPQELTKIYSNSTIEYSWDGRISTGEYYAEGTSTLLRNGERRAGRWRLEGKQRVCFQPVTEKLATCYTYYEDDQQKGRYLARVVPTQGEICFEIKSRKRPASCDQSNTL